MNEPSSFVNGAVPAGCRNATLNHPPYMPRKDPGLLHLQRPGWEKQWLLELSSQSVPWALCAGPHWCCGLLGPRDRSTSCTLPPRVCVCYWIPWVSFWNLLREHVTVVMSPIVLTARFLSSSGLLKFTHTISITPMGKMMWLPHW